ncbi:hypothetical protein BDB01DRAFT_897596 [Pilobolus umbonatus]|nr:hypothetical protein BDB01DRAFT_897596 [Pilobolus umbonatus]
MSSTKMRMHPGMGQNHLIELCIQLLNTAVLIVLIRILLIVENPIDDYRNKIKSSMSGDNLVRQVLSHWIEVNPIIGFGFLMTVWLLGIRQNLEFKCLYMSDSITIETADGDTNHF